MPKLWTISDLHFENYPEGRAPALNPPDDFDILLVAGDIYEGRPIDAIREIAKLASGRPSVVVLGNWDYASLPMQEAVTIARRAGADHGVHVLEASAVEIDGITFAGGTLWNDYYPKNERLDLDAIMRGKQFSLRHPHPAMPYEEPIFVGVGAEMRPATYQDIARAHDRVIEAIEEAKADVVITHYPPTERALAAAAGAALWHYGHVHEFERRMHGDIEIVLNPRQSRVFAGKMVVDVPVRPRAVLEI